MCKNKGKLITISGPAAAGIVEDKFIEYVLYAGNYYGTSKESVFSMLNSGINVILALGYESAHKVKEAYHAAITVNILSSSGENLIAQKQNADIVLVNENPKDTAKQFVKQVENL